METSDTRGLVIQLHGDYADKCVLEICQEKKSLKIVG